MAEQYSANSICSHTVLKFYRVDGGSCYCYHPITIWSGLLGTFVFREQLRDCECNHP